MSLVERSLPALLSLDLSFDVGEMMIQFRGIFEPGQLIVHQYLVIPVKNRPHLTVTPCPPYCEIIILLFNASYPPSVHKESDVYVARIRMQGES
jgi:hypothetical protein